MHCKCALECEYKVVNLEQHVCHHNVPVYLLLDVGGLAVTIWIVSWHWYWQSNEHPTAMHIHKPTTGRCSHSTSVRIHFMRWENVARLNAKVHCVALSLRKNHCPTYKLGTYSHRIMGNETLHIYIRKKRKIIVRHHITVRLKFVLFLFPTWLFLKWRKSIIL